MSINIQSTRVTWAAIYVIAGLVFSTGIAWKSIIKNEETNTTQWRYINEVQTDIKNQSAQQAPKFNDLTIAIVKLTSSIEQAELRAKREEAEREKGEQLAKELNEKITNIQVQIGRINATLANQR